MFITQKIIKPLPNLSVTNATKIFPANPSHLKKIAPSAVRGYLKQPIRSILKSKPKWVCQEYREAYMEAAIEQGVAWQIRINRNARHMSQTQLARLINSKQSAISRMEDPTYGAHSLDTLIDVAKAFDCALSIKFISYSQLAYDSEKLAESDVYATSFESELKEIYGEKTPIA